MNPSLSFRTILIVIYVYTSCDSEVLKIKTNYIKIKFGRYKFIFPSFAIKYFVFFQSGNLNDWMMKYILRFGFHFEFGF